MNKKGYMMDSGVDVVDGLILIVLFTGFMFAGAIFDLKWYVYVLVFFLSLLIWSSYGGLVCKWRFGDE